MCGLFGGLSSTLVEQERQVVRGLCVVNSFRGMDSTGIVDYVADPGKGSVAFQYWKREVTPLDFVQDGWLDCEQRWTKKSPRLIIGHTRSATKGTVSANNAHPFRHGDIIGVHNGTIWGEFANSKRFETDSEAIFYNINERGIQKTLEDMSSLNLPAYALIWVNIKEKTLNFLTNGRRPLSFARDGAMGSTLYWSSDNAGLYLGLKYSGYNNAKWEIDSAEVDQLFTYDLTKPQGLKPVKREMKIPVRTHVSTSGSYLVEDTHRAPIAEATKTNVLPFRPGINPAQNLLASQGSYLDESWLLQFSKKNKDKFYCRWDVATERWFGVWAFERLQSARRRAKNVKRKEEPAAQVADKIDEGKFCGVPGNTDGKGTSIAKNPPVAWYDRIVWEIDGFVVDYDQWMKTTKGGCCYCSKIDAELNSECVWLDHNNFLCMSCAKDALNPITTVSKFFEGEYHSIRRLIDDAETKLAAERSIYEVYGPYAKTA